MIKYPEHSDWCAHLLDIGATLLNPTHEPCLDTLSCVAEKDDNGENIA